MKFNNHLSDKYQHVNFTTENNGGGGSGGDDDDDNDDNNNNNINMSFQFFVDTIP